MDASWTRRRYASRMRIFAATIAAIGFVTTPLRATEASLPAPAPFDACQAVGVRAAADLIGEPIRKNAPNYREVVATPRESSLCAYDGVDNGQLSVLLLRFGTTVKDRASLETFRSSYERAAAEQYGKPTTTTVDGVTLVAFVGERGEVLDVAAFTSAAAARITLTFGKARVSELDALALSLVRTTYGAGPTAPPSASPDIAPCGRRADHARYHG